MNNPLTNAITRSCQRIAGIALLLLLGLAQPVWAALLVNAGNGTVTDSTTSLVWDQCPYGLSDPNCATGIAFYGNWAGALDVAVAANAASYKGFTDWRVPNRNELESIVKIDGLPTIDTTAFPGTPTDPFWSSTTYTPVPYIAWIVNFDYGSIETSNKTDDNYVRLVRSGQSFASFDVLAAASADLSITKTDGVTTAVPGGSVTYTITASNAGPDAVTVATVADTFPAALTATWTCVGAAGGTCTASGSGNINDSTVNLPVGASVIYTVSATVSPSATGTLSNTATVSSAIADPNPANNSATDTDTLTPQADLSITKTDGVTSVNPGGSVTYTIIASNAGPSNAPVSTVADTLPAALTGATWTCVGATGGTCTASGSGDIYDTVSLPAGGSVTYTLTATVSAAATGTLSNTATVSSTIGDPAPGNNSATTTTTVSAVVVVPPSPEVTIPGLNVSPACGQVAWPPIVNLGAGEGPAFAADMVTILSKELGMPLRWVEQTAACGSVALAGYNGGNLAFTPFGFQTGDGRPNGIYPVGNGQYQVVRNGQQLTLAPALVHLDQLAALLPGIVASQADNGVITATYNGLTYVVQPSVAVQLEPASGVAQLVVGGDGLMYFIDAQGNKQVLYPAFTEPRALRNILRGLDLFSTLSIELDGTASIVYNGQRYTLVPDMTLLSVPADRAGQDWWQESDTRYRVTNVETFPWRVWSQGFTVRP